MRRLGYWLIGLIILSFVSNFFLPYAGLVSVLGYVVTIVLWLAYYGYFSFGILMAGKWYLEREQEKESGKERKPKSKRIKHKDKNGRNKPQIVVACDATKYQKLRDTQNHLLQ